LGQFEVTTSQAGPPNPSMQTQASDTQAPALEHELGHSLLTKVTPAASHKSATSPRMGFFVLFGQSRECVKTRKFWNHCWRDLKLTSLCAKKAIFLHQSQGRDSLSLCPFQDQFSFIEIIFEHCMSMTQAWFTLSFISFPD
jgi:hypothetical protein